MPHLPLSPDEDVAWRALVRLMVVLPRAIDDDLVRRTGLGLTPYVVLMNLSEAEDDRLRMSELATRTALSASRMTRVVDNLERDGLIARGSSPENHRVSLARLTDRGRQRLQEAWPAHLAGARELVVDHLGPHELAGFTEVVRRLVAVIEGASPAATGQRDAGAPPGDAVSAAEPAPG